MADAMMPQSRANDSTPANMFVSPSTASETSPDDLDERLDYRIAIPIRSPRRQSIREHGLGRLQRLSSTERLRRRQLRQEQALKRRVNAPVDLRMLDHVDSYDDNVVCPICRCPFVDPVLLAECEHCFCWDCIRQCWASRPSYTPLAPRGECPTCRSPAKIGPRTATSKILTNIIGELLVKCPNSDVGCRAQVKRGEIQDHLNVYCDYALVGCTTDGCRQLVQRKDIDEPCLHSPVTCLDCRDELQQWELESHWQSECPDREVLCIDCQEPVPSRTLDEHQQTTCPSAIIFCSGHAIGGCTYQHKRSEAHLHEADCVFAKLAPAWKRDQERLEQQEIANKRMSRKLAAFEDMFAAWRYMPQSSRPSSSSRESGIDREWSSSSLQAPRSNDRQPNSRLAHATDAASRTVEQQLTGATNTTDNITSTLNDDTAIFDNQNSSTQHFPRPATPDGPYASPLHHLLSMHEALRDEVARVGQTLAELDGRHSMQILNENLRTREELSYLGAQVGALQRQVHWLTSAQLQRQHSRGGRRVGSSSASGPSGNTSGGGAVEGVVGAVNTAATALRGAAQLVGVGQGPQDNGIGVRRRASEEGRTKL